MAADEELTWDRALLDGGACRPSLAQLGGADLVNDIENPPVDDGTEPEAKQLNQRAKQHAAFGRVVHPVKMTIDCSSGSAVKVALQTCSATLTFADFTVAISPTGVTTISWATGKVPPMSCDPEVTVNSDGDYSGIAYIASPTSVVVKTRLAGALANARWTLSIN